jgi:hypothetical protein
VGSTKAFIYSFVPRLTGTGGQETMSQVFINDASPIILERKTGVSEILRIVNINGQVIYNEPLPEFSETIRIQAANYPTGIYFASLLRNDGTTFTTKFVHRR